MKKCKQCGQDMIVVEQAVIGFPGYHVAGSRQMYCGRCDTPPVVELRCDFGPVMLEATAPSDADLAIHATEMVEAWNARYAVGQAVVVKQDGEEDWTLTTTRSEAQIVGRTAVVWLTGIDSSYDLAWILPVKQEGIL